MGISKKAGIAFRSLSEISKYPELVKEVIEELEKKERNVISDCSATNIGNRAFVVASEKLEEFKSIKPNSDIRRKMEETVEKIKINNLTPIGEQKNVQGQKINN